MPSSSLGRDEPEGPGSLSQADPSTARPGVGGTLLHQHWAERPGVSCPPLRSPVGIGPRPHPLDTGAQPPSFKDGKPPTGAEAQAAAAGRAGTGAICPWILDLQSGATCLRPSWPLGMREGGLGIREAHLSRGGDNTGWRGCRSGYPGMEGVLTAGSTASATDKEQ